MPDSLGRTVGDHVSLSAGPSAPALDAVFGLMTRWRFVIGAQILDFGLIIGVFLLIYPLASLHGGAVPLRYALGAAAIALVAHFSFFQAHLYDWQALSDESAALKSILLRWTTLFMALAALAALAHQPTAYSRLWFVSFYAGGAVALSAGRVAVAAMIRGWIARGYAAQTVAIVGGNELAEQLIARFESNNFGVRIVGVFDDRSRDNLTDIRGVPKLGSVADLLEYAKLAVIDTVVVTLPITATTRINSVIRQLRQQPLNVRVLPGPIGLERISPIRLARTELPGVQLIAVADRPISEVALVMKGLFDRVVAGIALLLLSPLFLVCAIGIAANSPGPIFFRQKRIGYKGREFDIFKFRTMNVADRPNTRLTERNDPRIFRFGSILRKTSIDELPQLLNVLKGDMSLVGPRPHMPEARAAGMLYFEAVNEYAGRHRVKPGITGWAQVNGWRGPTETVEQIERRVEHDIYYIENWSLILDFVILVKTVFVGFFGENAF